MIEGKPAIALLGPAGHAATDAILAQAAATGKAVVNAGYTLVVRADDGVAAAAAKDLAAEDPIFAVVSSDDDAPSKTTPAAHVKAEGQLQALEQVLSVADALILLPGDLFALAALTQVWAHGTTPRGPFRQVVLLGPRWPQLVTALADAADLDQKTRSMVTFANEPAEAVEALRYYIGGSR